MSNNIPADFLEWMDSENVTSNQKNRLDSLLAGSLHVRMFLIGLFDFNANWDQIAKAAMEVQPSRQSPVEQVAAMCPTMLDIDSEELGQTLENMQDGGYRDFVKDVLRKLTMQQRNELSDYVRL